MIVSVAVTTDCHSMEPPAGTIKSCKLSAVKFDRALIHRLRLTHKVLPAQRLCSRYGLRLVSVE